MKQFVFYAQRAWHSPYWNNQYMMHTHALHVLRTSTVFDLSRITMFLWEMLYPQRRNWGLFFNVLGFPKGYRDNQSWKKFKLTLSNSINIINTTNHLSSKTMYFQLNQNIVLSMICDGVFLFVFFFRIYMFTVWTLKQLCLLLAAMSY